MAQFFLVKDSLNMYKTGDQQAKAADCPFSAHSWVLSQQPGGAAAAGCGWQCSVQAQAARLGMWGIHSPQWYLWAGKHSPAAEMLQAASGWWILQVWLLKAEAGYHILFVISIGTLSWICQLLYKEPLYILCPSARGISPEVFWTGVLQKLHAFISSNKALKHLINFKHTNNLTTPGHPHAWN